MERFGNGEVSADIFKNCIDCAVQCELGTRAALLSSFSNRLLEAHSGEEGEELDTNIETTYPNLQIDEIGTTIKNGIVSLAQATDFRIELLKAQSVAHAESCNGTYKIELADEENIYILTFCSSDLPHIVKEGDKDKVVFHIEVQPKIAA